MRVSAWCQWFSLSVLVEIGGNGGNADPLVAAGEKIRAQLLLQMQWTMGNELLAAAWISKRRVAPFCAQNS